MYACTVRCGFETVSVNARIEEKYSPEELFRLRLTPPVPAAESSLSDDYFYYFNYHYDDDDDDDGYYYCYYTLCIVQTRVCVCVVLTVVGPRTRFYCDYRK